MHSLDEIPTNVVVLNISLPQSTEYTNKVHTYVCTYLC